MSTPDTEITADESVFQLVCDMQTELRDMLNALGGKQGDGLVEHYQFYTAGHINKALEGYVLLRLNGRVAASKHLIRPVLEGVIRVTAVRKSPDLMFRIAFSEFEETRKWVRPFNEGQGIDGLQEIDRQWSEFESAYVQKYPEHNCIKKKLTLRCAAENAGIDSYYDSHYRLFCLFTHGAFRATTGDLEDFEPEDNRTMALCAFAILDCLVSLGAAPTRMTSFKRRISQLNPKA